MRILPLALKSDQRGSHATRITLFASAIEHGPDRPRQSGRMAANSARPGRGSRQCMGQFEQLALRQLLPMRVRWYATGRNGSLGQAPEECSYLALNARHLEVAIPFQQLILGQTVPIASLRCRKRALAYCFDNGGLISGGERVIVCGGRLRSPSAACAAIPATFEACCSLLEKRFFMGGPAQSRPPAIPAYLAGFTK